MLHWCSNGSEGGVLLVVIVLSGKGVTKDQGRFHEDAVEGILWSGAADSVVATDQVCVGGASSVNSAGGGP